MISLNQILKQINISKGKIVKLFSSFVFVFLFLFFNQIIIQNSFAQSTFNKERIKEASEKFVLSEFGENSKPEFLLDFNDKKFQESGVKVKFNILRNEESSIQNLELSYIANEKTLMIQRIPFRVRIIKEVVVAKKDISPEELINEDDLILVSREITNFNEILSNLNDATNKIAKTKIRAGNIIRKNELSSPKLVKRGQEVTVEVNSGSVTIQTSGIAQQDGGLGDIIRVRRNREFNDSVLEGIISENGTVRIKI